jgi:hypothetical protein
MPEDILVIQSGTSTVESLAVGGKLEIQGGSLRANGVVIN